MEMVVDDVDECSSYGTKYSEGEEMEATPNAVGEDKGEPLKALHASIAAINAG